MSEKPTFLRKALVALAIGLSAGIVPIRAANAVVTNQATETITAFGDGVTVNFTIGFYFQEASDVVVSLLDETTTPYVTTTIAQGSGASKFTVTGTSPGTTVTMGTAPTTTQKLIIQRILPFTQTVDYVETDAFPAEDHQEAMDKNVMLMQQVNAAVATKLGLSSTSTFATPTFPDPSANQILAYNSDGLTLGLIPGTLSAGNTIEYNGSAWTAFDLTGSLGTLTSGLAAHIANTSNPHSVTAAQVGSATAQWNANKIQGTLVDASLLSDGRVLQYNAASGNIIYAPTPVSANLTDTHVFIGNGSNLAADTAISGDATLADTGALSVVTVGGSTAANIHAAEGLANAATAANTASQIVKRDGSGQVAATTFTGALVGNASTATSAASATNLAGGLGGSVPYQSAAGTTAMLANGTAGSVLQSNGTTLAPTWATGFLTNPMSTLGDIVYENSTPTAARLAGNTTTTFMVLGSTGTGTIAQTPAWTGISTIPGSVTAGSTGNVRIEEANSAASCTTSTCTTTGTSGISSVTRGGNGAYTANFVAGTFTTAPACTCSGNNFLCNSNASPTTSSWSFNNENLAGTGGDSAFSVICVGLH